MIEIKGINFRYAGGTDAGGLWDIDLTIPDGQVLLLCGESGCGKTTLTRLVNGLIPNYYEGELTGEVLINGNVVSQMPLYETAKLVGSVFQNPRTQFFTIDTTSELAFGSENLGLPEKEIVRRVWTASKETRLESLLGRNLFELSGGEKRRAALAGIIAMKPKYLVLDEPMAGLDPLGRKAILDTIDNLRASLGCAVLMVSHSMDDMADRAERVAVMNGGRLVMEGKTRDVFAQSELLTSIGLDVPQVSKLGMELRKRGIDIPENIYEIEEMELALLKLLSKGGRA